MCVCDEGRLRSLVNTSPTHSSRSQRTDSTTRCLLQRNTKARALSSSQNLLASSLTGWLTKRPAGVPITIASAFLSWIPLFIKTLVSAFLWFFLAALRAHVGSSHEKAAHRHIIPPWHEKESSRLLPVVKLFLSVFAFFPIVMHFPFCTTTVRWYF